MFFDLIAKLLVLVAKILSSLTGKAKKAGLTPAKTAAIARALSAKNAKVWGRVKEYSLSVSGTLAKLARAEAPEQPGSASGMSEIIKAITSADFLEFLLGGETEKDERSEKGGGVELMQDGSVLILGVAATRAKIPGVQVYPWAGVRRSMFTSLANAFGEKGNFKTAWRQKIADHNSLVLPQLLAQAVCLSPAGNPAGTKQRLKTIKMTAYTALFSPSSPKTIEIRHIAGTRDWTWERLFEWWDEQAGV